ncbi:MAG: hypothetical protein WC776_05440 [Patescibacteria group bacterium]
MILNELPQIDDVKKYIAEVVNPARKRRGMKEITDEEVVIVFRIIDGFQRDWISRTESEAKG